MKMLTRRMVATLSWICVFALAITLVPVANVFAQETTAVILAPVELKTGPNISSDVLATLSKGTQVTVVSAAEGWTKISLNGKSGYCNSDFISTGGKSQYATGVTTDYLNVRSGPGTSYKVLKVLPTGTDVVIIDNTDPNWAKISLAEGTVGYCNKAIMTITEVTKPQTPETQEQDMVTTDSAALRAGPGAAYSIVKILGKGTAVVAVDTTNSSWTKVTLSDNTTGYCSKAFLRAEERDTDTTGADEVIPLGKTLYIAGETGWSSSNNSIVKVENGFLEAVGTGRATVTSGGHSRIIAVTKAEPVKIAYTSPNSAPLNSDVSFIAITDTTRTGVKFEVNGQTIYATSQEQDGETYVWTGTCKMSTAGTFDVKTYSQKNGQWSTCDNGNTTVYVTTATDMVTTAVGNRRTSDECIRIIGEFEGYAGGQVYPDQLAGGIPTLGYGYTIASGEQFYNNLTKREAYALLVQTVNEGFYSTSVNKFLTNNSIKCNQRQFDALVSFTYNLGSGWMYSSDLADDLLNAFDPSTVGGGPITGTVINIDSDSSLSVRDKAATNETAIVKEKLHNGDVVTILDNGVLYNNNWYRVRTASGTEGYCTSTYLQLSQRAGQRDLAYISPTVFIYEIIQWNKAGGVSIPGLVYRRYDEAEMFLYGDYTRDGWNNKYQFPRPSNLMPSNLEL